LRGNCIGDEGATALTMVLATNTNLTSLNLRFNNIGDKGATALAMALTTNTSLTSLNLRGNNIGDEGATALAANTSPNLGSLKVDDNDIGDEGAMALAETDPAKRWRPGFPIPSLLRLSLYKVQTTPILDKSQLCTDLQAKLAKPKV